MANRPQGDTTWIEPDSQAEFSKYPYNHVQQTESGHSMEFDDTPGYERIRLQHRTGSFTEIQSDGTEIHKIVGDGYDIIAKNNHVLIRGYCTVTIQGDSVLNIQGDAYQQVEGDVIQTVEGKMTTVAKGDVNLSSESDININAGGIGNPLGGRVVLRASDSVHVDGDLTVSGSISTSGSLSTLGNVIAVQKLFSTQGIVTLGGLNVGAPDISGPLPPGIINATGAINVPTVNALVLNDVFGPVVLMRAIFSTHTHPGKVYGPPYRSQF
jgi:hypothetical protein